MFHSGYFMSILKEDIVRAFIEAKKPDFIAVDIQPDYEKAFGYSIHEFTNWLNKNYKKFDSILFLFNGPDLGFPSKEELQYWYIENGLLERVIESCEFYDKGYAFFRYCIDSGIDDEDIVKLVQYMDKNSITDSRDISDEVWEYYAKEYSGQEIRELLQYSGDMINIPDLMDVLRRYNSDIILTGGGVNECLKEVEISLKALNKKYTLLKEWDY